MNKLYVLPLLLSICACSTVGGRTSVIERADGLPSAPEWASITKPVFDLDGKRYYLSYVEVDGDASKSAALNMSDEKALSEPLKSLVDQFLDQNQVGEDLVESTGQRVISATRSFRPPMPDLHISKRYWEIVETKIDGSSPSGKTMLRAYSLAEIPTIELEKAKQAYFSRLSGNSEIKKILKDVGTKQRDRALSSE